MKLFIALMALATVGCAQLANPAGAVPPVIMKDSNLKIMSTVCSGAVEDWPDCYGRAHKACANGFEVIDKIESVVGAKRELDFKCN